MHQIETGKIYKNRNGSDYRCLGIDNIGNPIMQHTTSKWTFTAHKINMYPDGTIEWGHSTGGRFVPDNQKNAAADNRQQQKKKLKLALEKYGIPRDVYIDCPGSQKGAQSKVLEAVEVIQGERYSSLGAARLEYSSRELFEFWLQYEGLIGYATPILSVLKALNDYDSNAATAGLSYTTTAAEIKAAKSKVDHIDSRQKSDVTRVSALIKKIVPSDEMTLQVTRKGICIYGCWHWSEELSWCLGKKVLCVITQKTAFVLHKNRCITKFAL